VLKVKGAASMKFWPDDINADDVLSPKEIMAEAGAELEAKVGILFADIQENKLPDRVVLSFTIINHRANMEVKLFEAAHRLGEPYPIAISPPANDIPEFLKKKVYVPGSVGIAEYMRTSGMLVESTPGHYIDNKWVSATPGEFRRKLQELFSSEAVTTKVMSLLAQPPIVSMESGPTGEAVARPKPEGDATPE
jgi:hypothetical protein